MSSPIGLSIPNAAQSSAFADAWAKADKASLNDFGAMHGSPSAQNLFKLANAAMKFGAPRRAMLLKSNRYAEKSKSRMDWLGLSVAAEIWPNSEEDYAKLAIEAFIEGCAKVPETANAPWPEEANRALARCASILPKRAVFEESLAGLAFIPSALPALGIAQISEASLIAKADQIAKAAAAAHPIHEADPDIPLETSDAPAAPTGFTQDAEPLRAQTSPPSSTPLGEVQALIEQALALIESSAAPASPAAPAPADFEQPASMAKINLARVAENHRLKAENTQLRAEKADLAAQNASLMAQIKAMSNRSPPQRSARVPEPARPAKAPSSKPGRS